MENITEIEKSFLIYFYRKGNIKFLKKPLTYATEIGITEANYIDCLKNLSLLGYIEEGIIDGSTDVKLTSTGISFCRDIASYSNLGLLGRIINHLEKRNSIYTLGISLLALVISIIALTK